MVVKLLGDDDEQLKLRTTALPTWPSADDVPLANGHVSCLEFFGGLILFFSQPFRWPTYIAAIPFPGSFVTDFSFNDIVGLINYKQH